MKNSTSYSDHSHHVPHTSQTEGSKSWRRTMLELGASASAKGSSRLLGYQSFDTKKEGRFIKRFRSESASQKRLARRSSDKGRRRAASLSRKNFPVRWMRPHSSIPPYSFGSFSLNKEEDVEQHTVAQDASSAKEHVRTTSLPPRLAALISMPSPDEKDAKSVEFYMQLCSLKEGVLFAGRYKIGAMRLQGKPQCRYATNERTGRRVFLKFFRRGSTEFENAVKIHKVLEPENKFVSRLLESIENAHGFPPCLVYERGDDDLSHRMKHRQMTAIDQKALLYSVLESLNYLHTLGITHSNLKPSHVLWFEAERTWKLADLEYATQGKQSVLQQDLTIDASSRDLFEALEDAETSATLTPAVDMWSFGIIAFEILTCASVTDSIGVIEYLDRKLQLASDNADETAHIWLSANPHGRCFSENVENQNLRLIESFLRKNPDERRTAADAMEDPLFRSAMDLYQRRNSQENIPIGVLEKQMEIEMPDWGWTVGIADRLKFDVDMEYLLKDTDGNLPFHLRTGEAAWSFEDHDLPQRPIYYTKLGQTYRLRIRVTPEAASDLIIQRIVSVTVRPPDSDVVTLEVQQQRQDDAIVALALFQPSTLGSISLQMISPHRGSVKEKYVRLEVGITLLLGKPVSRELAVHKAIYCKMITPNNKLRFQRLIGMVKNENVLRHLSDSK